MILLALVLASQEPERTAVSAVLSTPHAKGRNLVWCSTFQLAWNALGQELCGEPLRLQGTPPIEQALNAGGIGKQDLDPASVYVKAARLSPGLIADIDAALKKQFGEHAPPPLPEPAAKVGALAYAFLFKNLLFKAPFDRQREPLSWGGGPVQAFGLLKVDGQTPPDLRSQVRILNDRRGAYVVELKSTSAKDRLILAQTEPKATLKETLDDVRERVRRPSAPPFVIQVTDQFLMPCIDIALDRSYDEIVGRAVLNPKLEGHLVAEARQSLRFVLDEKGAAVKADAKILVPKNGHAPRRLVFDQPFLLYLEQTGAEHPYLAIWFENPDLFLKVDGK